MSAAAARAGLRDRADAAREGARHCRCEEQQLQDQKDGTVAGERQPKIVDQKASLKAMANQDGIEMMPIEDNFTPVTAQDLIDPSRKLRLALGRWTPESSARGGSVVVSLFHDPQLRSDRLTMPLAAEERRLLEILGPVARDWKVFESGESRKLTEIWVDIREGDDEVRIEFAPPRLSIALEAEAIARADIPGISDQPRDLLLYMFRSIPLMPTWVEGYAQPWGKHAVSFWTSSNIVREVAGEAPGREQPGSETELVRVAGREVQL